MQLQMTPDEALERLMEGNTRFIKNRGRRPDLVKQVHDTAGGQYPFAVILGCIDSRVPSELIFDQGIGDIFNARVAGNVVNEDILGSLEYACKVAGSKLIMVLGHTGCGAVTAACNHVELGNITSLLGKMTAAVLACGKGPAEVDEVSAQNVKLSIQRIREESGILSEMESDGKIQVHGAMYDVSTGKVTLLD
jgi:carbonic anhydrase